MAYSGAGEDPPRVGSLKERPGTCATDSAPRTRGASTGKDAVGELPSNQGRWGQLGPSALRSLIEWRPRLPAAGRSTPVFHEGFDRSRGLRAGLPPQSEPPFPGAPLEVIGPAAADERHANALGQRLLRAPFGRTLALVGLRRRIHRAAP